MSSHLPATSQRSRATIMAELATVLRDSDTRTTSIESAIAQAGVSIPEISAQFGSTRELLLAMVSQLSDTMSASLTAAPAGTDLEQRLLEFGQCVTDIYASSHLHTLYRIAVTESIRHTGLGRDFYEAGPGRLTQRLADFLQLAQVEGALRCADAHLLASHFLSLLRANLDIADSVPHERAARPVADEAYVRDAVELFCRGINGA